MDTSPTPAPFSWTKIKLANNTAQNNQYKEENWYTEGNDV